MILPAPWTLPFSQRPKHCAPRCAASGLSAHALTAIRREENEYSRSYASEIVACQFADGSARRLFLKYMTTLDESHRDHGMRGGLAYEARVYSELLCGVIRPAFYGLHTGPDGALWLVLECLDDTVPLDLADDETAIFKAAAWLGKFHAGQERRVETKRPADLRIYDAEFYRGWARRTNEFAGEGHQRAPWLAGLGAEFDLVIDTLLTSPLTLVHGEFYPHNIIFREGEIFTVDWESAALATGEIDLVALTEGWSENTEKKCQRAYREARWPGGAPELFEHRIAAARVFMHLRWMGEHPSWAAEEKEALWQITELKRWAERFGLTR